MGVHIHNGGPHRHRQHQLVALDAGTVTTGTRLAVLGLVLALEAVVNQRIQGFISHQVYRAAVAAVATIRPALGNVFLTPETQTAMTALARFHDNGGFVYKFHA